MVDRIRPGTKRARALRRRKDGTFAPWAGGYKKSELKKKENTFQGIAVHIGKEFKRQHGRTARIGEAVRTKKTDGTFHKQAFWYLKTRYGWRRMNQQFSPGPAQIKAALKRAKPGR